MWSQHVKSQPVKIGPEQPGYMASLLKCFFYLCHEHLVNLLYIHLMDCNVLSCVFFVKIITKMEQNQRWNRANLLTMLHFHSIKLDEACVLYFLE